MRFSRKNSNIDIEINEVMMQRTNNNNMAKSAGRRVGSSTTLNRKYVKRPKKKAKTPLSASTKRSSKIQRFNREDMEPSQTVVSISSLHEKDLDDRKDGMKNVSSIESSLIQDDFNNPSLPVMPKIQKRNRMNQSVVSRRIPRSIDVADGDFKRGNNTISRRVRYTEPAPNNTYYLLQQPSRLQGMTTEMMAKAEKMPEMEKQVVMNDMPNMKKQTVMNGASNMKKQTVAKKKMTARELKEQAIQKAMMSASAAQNTRPVKKRLKSSKARFYNINHFILAFACAAVSVFAITYFVSLNMPDISLKVAAMQTGINASYPSYIPRGYAISSIVSENKKIVLTFRNSDTDKTYKLFEEASTWDSNSLVNNYVKETFGDSYQTIKEQGLTIYISGSNAAWVNGGNVYKIEDEGNTLTQKQIKTIATSL